MGRLDFSIIDKRIKPPSERVAIGGREKNKKITLGILKALDCEYTEITEGSVTIIEADNRKTRFIGAKVNDKDISVIRACGEVKRAVIKFQKENGKLKSHKYKQVWRSDDKLADYVKKGGREIALVDINHCYWRILFINNIINETLYKKYQKNRQARVVPVGCLNKSKVITRKIGEEILERKVIKNPLRWVWNFVCWTTYNIMKQVIKACEGNVFSYQTDGIYLPTKYVPKATGVIRDLNFDCKTIKYEIVGRANKGSYIILKNIETGKFKRANLGKINDLMDILPKIEYKEIDIE